MAKNNNSSDLLAEVIEAVRKNARYQIISEELVRQVAAAELAKGRGKKEAIKATRSKLHQVAGAYQEKEIPYAAWTEELAALPHDLQSPELRAFCQKAMGMHASTNERLPILEEIFQRAFAEIGAVHSILDLACGLNPLAIPWMPLAPGAAYHACDIYTDMIDFLNQFFVHARVNGTASICDLTSGVPQTPVQLALLLKTIPCLEQMQKGIGAQLLDAIPARFILVSFPVRSLGGRSKGMPAFYENQFMDIVEQKQWHVKKIEFSAELTFLVEKVDVEREK
ncbi:MAG: hypothetical protein JW750_08845 [Anaerolineaceae bacterium]|nr:hypothetical protein [Anaerolineaceae bacterium]